MWVISPRSHGKAEKKSKVETKVSKAEVDRIHEFDGVNGEAKWFAECEKKHKTNDDRVFEIILEEVEYA